MPKAMWAPWRMEYLLEYEKPNGCVFCNALEGDAEQLADNLVLATREHSYVIMNRFPYTHGHIMVVPRRHVSKLAELSREESSCLFHLTTDAQSTLESTLGSHGMNMGMNLGKCGGAGIADHIHVHLVPRWEGDTNFMPMLADARVMPEHLTSTYQRLIETFSNLTE